jgi:RHS repeat-associated protein
MRARNAKTTATNDGYVTEIYANSINYQDSKGNWQPIDDTLVPAGVNGFASKNKANGYTALLPASLNAPVRFIQPVGSVEFALIGASGSIITKGQTATYANALTGVTVTFDAQPDSLKEALSISNSQAPTTFTYALTVSSGWLARANKVGGINLIDKAGVVQAAFRAPVMSDTSHTASATSQAVTMSLGGTTGHQTITVVADKTWINTPGRVFPVVIDPTIDTNVNYYDPHDCFIQNTNPNGSFCSSQGTTTLTTNPLGFDGTTVNRNLYWFGVSTTRYSIPVPNSNILDAELDFTLSSSTSTGAVPVTVYPITQAWDDAGASWNNANTGIAWTTPGGTVGSAITTVNVGPTTGAFAIYNLTSTVQNWVSGNVTDNGFLLRAANEGTNALLQINNDNFGTSSTDPGRPHLRVQWNGWGGLQPWYKFEGKQLDDRMSIAVNVANGQLVVHNQDLAVHGVGQNLTVDRYYNSLSDLQWHLGNGWNLSQGCDVQIDVDDHDGVAYKGPDGYQVLFRSNGSGGYITPPGFNADLVKNGDGTFTLTFRGSNLKYNFQGPGCLQNEVDRNGNTISMSYNGSLQTITDTENKATTFTYNSPFSSDFITKMTDSAGRTYQYGYDANGNLTTYTDANNKITSYAYNSNLQMSQIKDPNGNIVNFTYGPNYPQPLSQISYVNPSCSGGACNTNFAYNSGAGPCTSSGIWMNTVATDANGHNTTYCYDNQGRIKEVRDANNNQRATSYDSNSNVTTLTDAISSITQLTYDNNNNLTKIQAPPSAGGQNPASASFGYQAPGQAFLPSSRTDSLGSCRAFTYDSSGNLTNVYDGQATGCDGMTGGVDSCKAYQGDPSGTCGATTTVTCTNAHAGELCWTKDGKSNKTSYGYDANHNLRTVTPPSPLGVTTIVVDSLSRPSSVTDGKGQKTTYSYDALDRITQILFGGATSCGSRTTCTTFNYDGDGNLSSRIDVTGTTTFSYDTMSRLTTKTLPSTSWNCLGQTGMTFAYDPVGNLTTYCDAGGTVTYAYDAVNRVQNMAEPTGTCSGTPTLCSTFSYDNDNRLTMLTFPGGATQNLSYDGAGNQKTAVGKDSLGNVLTSFSYTYSVGTQDKGVRLSTTEADPLANLTTSYAYDPFEHLTSASNSQTTLHYVYDAAGNRCSTGTTCDGTWAYNAANELTASPGVSSYRYDANGNLTSSSTGGSFTYNSQDQTTAATWNGQTLSGMTYADVGQAERTAAGATTFASSPLGVQISSSAAANTFFLRDGKGNLIGEIVPGTPQTHWYYLKDALGSIVAVINGTGSTVANRYGYDPFGKVTTASQPNPWGFVGGFQDSTKLVKFGTRYYDPSTGRWTQQDSMGGGIAQPSTLDRYLYAADEPIDRADPRGLDITSDILDILANAGWETIGCVTGAALGAFAGAAVAVAFVATAEFAPIAAFGGAIVGCAIGAVYNYYGPIKL